MATKAQLEALARGRRAKQARAYADAMNTETDPAIAAEVKGLPGIKLRGKAKAVHGGSSWWVWLLLVALVLVVLLVVGLSVVDTTSTALASSRGLVPLRPSAVAEGSGRRVIITRPRKSYVTKETRDKFEKAIASLPAQGPPIRVKDASDADGGPLSPHASHDTGHDIDIDTESMYQPGESTTRLATVQALVNAFLDNGAKVVASTIPGLARTTAWDGHDKHMHVRF